ncbi:hypothetical protein METBIDRAFT_31817 [Metschnikowia bicuspidata var. bicuspidata NRRL YB-4993]|uniref:VWFA domain-containing protein n=1 Tax=Metschnikowia bicuspidata var. bicuspidata NRRL YB-4993 TaxID=869754 RepID=A0A1A0HBK4_9ASCO|nr:hypothetical protein METBIDRAFT_31817 [Metschnikowia bicuspidata var. bicuspidata NRRL YB-4993]OBA21257.1 hypothetical protein METBIDRAFT_31817 [Metschnikowia bicuspidata var. bicuspidata NRRL YB-4993]
MSVHQPPPYSPVNDKLASKSAPVRNVPRAVTTSLIPESQLSALKGYDIVYLVDDSSLMAWREKISGIVPWPSARDALVSFSNLCAEWDDDGQDIYFINRPQGLKGCTPDEIAHAFDSAPPSGLTNMGRKLQQIAYEYFKDFDPIQTKPVNIIAITDGEFTDDVETVVRWIVKNLEKKNALANSFGIQFVQIGADIKAKKHLEYLDDNLSDLSRDIVDTVPWLEHRVDGRGFDGKYLLKAVCGAINKKLDNDNMNTRKKSGPDKQKRPGTFRRLFGRS